MPTIQVTVSRDHSGKCIKISGLTDSEISAVVASIRDGTRWVRRGTLGLEETSGSGPLPH